jgi:hypothetical protein
MACASVAGVGGKCARLRVRVICEAGNVIRPSACMRSSATRQVMSLSWPLGRIQLNSSHS